MGGDKFIERRLPPLVRDFSVDKLGSDLLDGTIKSGRKAGNIHITVNESRAGRHYDFVISSVAFEIESNFMLLAFDILNFIEQIYERIASKLCQLF